MKQPLSEKLIALEIDVDQWRRDIRTFVDSTIKELHAINDELSSGFANVDSTVRDSGGLQTNDAVETGFQTDGEELLLSEKTHNDSRSNNFAPFTETQTDDRLATLKRRLAERVATAGSNGETHLKSQVAPRN